MSPFNSLVHHFLWFWARCVCWLRWLPWTAQMLSAYPNSSAYLDFFRLINSMGAESPRNWLFLSRSYIPPSMYARTTSSCSPESATDPYAQSYESSPHSPILSFLWLILILFSQQRVAPASSLFPSGFLTKILYAYQCIYHIIYPLHPSKRCKLWSSPVCE